MDSIINEYVILTSEGRVFGFENKEEVDNYFKEQRMEKIREYCDMEGIDYEQLSSRRRKEIILEVDLDGNRDKVFRTKSIMKAINKSMMDEDIKSDLTDMLEEEFVEFYVEDYDGLSDILESLEEINI